MPTVYQRLQEYATRPDAIQFSDRKMRYIPNVLKKIWDKNMTNPPPYVESKEGVLVCQVRNYPDEFVATIDRVIMYAAEKVKAEQIRQSKLATPPPQPVVDQPPAKKVRKRIPANRSPQPLYTTRKIDGYDLQQKTP